jgi:hypothetical protein
VCLQVAERSLFLWNHEYIITLVAQYRQVRVQQQGVGADEAAWFVGFTPSQMT